MKSYLICCIYSQKVYCNRIVEAGSKKEALDKFFKANDEDKHKIINIIDLEV